MDKIQNRLKRIEGQIRGLQKLLTEGSDCEKIIIQFQAAKSALDATYAEVLKHNLKTCLETKDMVKIEKIIHKLTQQ